LGFFCKAAWEFQKRRIEAQHGGGGALAQALWRSRIRTAAVVAVGCSDLNLSFNLWLILIDFLSLTLSYLH